MISVKSWGSLRMNYSTMSSMKILEANANVDEASVRLCVRIVLMPHYFAMNALYPNIDKTLFTGLDGGVQWMAFLFVTISLCSVEAMRYHWDMVGIDVLICTGNLAWNPCQQAIISVLLSQLCTQMAYMGHASNFAPVHQINPGSLN
jgi:hypothetical protein